MTRNSKHKCHQSYHYCLLLLSPSLPLFSLDYLSFLSLLFFIPLFLLSTSIFDLPLPIVPPSHPSRSPQGTKRSSLCYIKLSGDRSQF